MPADSVPSPQRTDVAFALVAGLYASVVLVPLAVPAVDFPDAGTTYLSVLGGVTAVTVLVSVTVRRTAGVAERLGRPRRRLVPAVLPLVAVGLGATLYTVALGRPLPERAALFGAVSALGGLALGGLLGVMADTRYTKAVMADTETAAAWRAGWPERHRRLGTLVGGLLVVVSGLAFVAGAVFEMPLVRYGGQFVLPLGIVLASFGQPRNYRASSAGLELRAPVRRHLYRWEWFDGYMLTEEAIVLHPRAPWRLPLFCAREDIDDPEAVEAALERYLPRLPT